MTDREMLELAAKAAGIEHLSSEYCVNGPELWDIERKRWWRPLTNDGDALRLAVRLKIEIERCEYVNYSVYAGPPSSVKWKEEATSEQCIYMATRRAIVRAAAQIGAQM